MKFEKLIIITAIIGLLSLPTLAFSSATVTIDTHSEKQVTHTIDGKEETLFVQTESAAPGDVLRFILSFRNSGDAVATGVVLNNPIPPNAAYVAESATVFKDSQPIFSIDSGTNFNKPELLTIETKKTDGSVETTIASPEEYTNIRWKLPPLPAGASGQVSFNVIVK